MNSNYQLDFAFVRMDRFMTFFDVTEKNYILQGPVVQKPISLTLG